MMKRILSAALAFFAAATMCCAAQLTQVRLTLNKSDGIYAIGKKIVVKAALVGECDSPLSMYVLVNGRKVLEKDVTLSRKPQVVYQAKFDKPLCGMVYVVKKGGKKTDTGVGFAVAPEQLRPGYEDPADFTDFWNRELADMRACKPEVKLIPVDPGKKYAGRFNCYDLEISMHDGWPCRGYMAIPKNAAAGSLPIVMFFHGAGVKSKGCRSSISTAVKYASLGNGCIAVDINAHGMLNGQPQSYYDELEENELKDYKIRPLTTPHDLYYKLMYLRDIRALDYLCTRPEWDGERVLVTGASQGGAQSCAVAALDPRVKVIVPIVPGYMDIGGELVRPDNGWKRLYRTIATSESAKAVLPYFDSTNMLRHTQASIFMEVGLMDQTCPAEGMFAGFNVAASRDKQLHSYPYRRHSMKSNDQYYELWKEDIEKLRRQYMKDYLK